MSSNYEVSDETLRLLQVTSYIHTKNVTSWYREGEISCSSLGLCLAFNKIVIRVRHTREATIRSLELLLENNSERDTLLSMGT